MRNAEELSELLAAAGAKVERIMDGGHEVYRFPNGRQWPYSGLQSLKRFLRDNGYHHVLPERVKKEPSERRKVKRSVSKSVSLLSTLIPAAPRVPGFQDKLIKAVGPKATTRGKMLHKSFVPRFHPEDQQEVKDWREYEREQEMERLRQEESKRLEIATAEEDYQRSLERQPYKSNYRKPHERQEVAPVIKLAPEEIVIADSLRRWCSEEQSNQFVRDTLAAKRAGRATEEIAGQATRRIAQNNKGEVQMNAISQVAGAHKSSSAEIQHVKARIEQLRSSIAGKQRVITEEEEQIKILVEGLAVLEQSQPVLIRMAAIMSKPNGVAIVPDKKPPRGTSNPVTRRGEGKLRETVIISDIEAIGSPVGTRDLFATDHYPELTDGALYQQLRKMGQDGKLQIVNSAEGRVRYWLVGREVPEGFESVSGNTGVGVAATASV